MGIPGLQNHKKLVMGGLSTLAVTGFGFYCFLLIWADARLDRQLQLLEANGESLNVVDLLPPPVADEENGIYYFDQAATLYVEPTPEERAARWHLREDITGATVEDIRIVEQLLEKNRECLALLETANSMAVFRDNSRVIDPLNIEFSSQIFLRDAVNLFNTRAFLATRIGRSDQAFANCRQSLLLARGVFKGPAFISFCMYSSVECVALTGLNKVLRFYQPSPKEYVALHEVLDRIQPTRSLVLGIQGERCLTYTLMEYLRNSDSRLSTKSATFLIDFHGLESTLNPLHRLEQAWMLEKYADMLDRVRSNNPPDTDLWTQHDYPWYCQNAARVGVDDGIIYNLFCTLDRFKVELGMTRIALALLHYRANHSRFPDQLVELSLDPVPMDPYSGAPFHYRKTTEGGIILYSVGFDRVDDNGETDQLNNKPDMVWSWQP